jgi:protein TonB
MYSKHIPGYDLNDLLFENRNKAYGAFPLRKQYPKRLLLSILLVFGMVLAWALWVLSTGTIKNERIVKVPYQTVVYQLRNPEKPVPEPPKSISTKPKSRAIAQSTSGKIVVTSQPITPSIRLPFSGNGEQHPGDEGGDELGKIGTGSGSDSTQTLTGSTITETKSNAPVVDMAPSFPGGMAALRQFLERNLINPRDMEAGEEITVMVKFMVGYDGVLKEIETSDEVEPIFMREIRRVFARMPNWEPGRASGKKVTVQYQLPIKFMAGQ